MTRPAGRILTLATILLGTVACGGPDPSVDPSSAPPSTAPSGSPSSDVSPSASGITVDAALLEVLPAAIDGVARQDDAETAAEIATSPDLASSVRDLAVAIYVGPLATDTPGDYAVATVTRLRDGIFDDAWYRDWRDSFDAGVCEQAGGVESGRSEVEIAGRTVHRSTCAGGVVIHHVHLDDENIVVSVQGAGPADLGRRVVESVKE